MAKISGWQLPFKPSRVSKTTAPQQVKQRFLRNQANDVVPLVLTHDRIYILPSSRGWLFLLSLLIMLVTSINYSLSLGYALCFLLTGLFSATLMATYRNVAGITITNTDGGKASVGEPVSYRLSVANKRKLPCHALEIHIDNAYARQNLIAQDSEEHIELRVPAELRGWQSLGRMTLRSSYPLGLIVTWGFVHIDTKALIWPALETPAPALPANREQSTEDIGQVQQQRATQGEFAMLRDYVPGDSLSAIAWKTAARGLGVYTREFEESRAHGELQLAWHATAGLLDTEKKLARLASWCTQCHNNNVPYSLHLPAVTVDTGSGKAHFQRCMKHLALFGAEQEH